MFFSIVCYSCRRLWGINNEDFFPFSQIKDGERQKILVRKYFFIGLNDYDVVYHQVVNKKWDINVTGAVLDKCL